MRREFCLSFVLCLIASLGIAQQANIPKAQDSPASAIPEGEAHFTPEQLSQYYLVYTNHDVRYLRTLFEAYLRNDSGREDEFKILKEWNSDYYRSKFFVLSRNKSPFGGTLITIFFHDRPDKIFIAWVYPEGAAKELKLRILDSSKYSDEDVKRTRIRYRTLFDDIDHSM